MKAASALIGNSRRTVLLVLVALFIAAPLILWVGSSSKHPPDDLDEVRCRTLQKLLANGDEATAELKHEYTKKRCEELISGIASGDGGAQAATSFGASGQPHRHVPAKKGEARRRSAPPAKRPSCPRICTDPSTEGQWVERCKGGKPKPFVPAANTCPRTFVPAGDDCMIRFYNMDEANLCLQDQWLMVLGGSGAMNFGNTWIQQLDPLHTNEPFDGPKWYAKDCYSASGKDSCPSKMHKMATFVDWPNMEVDIVLDSEGRIIYKSGDGDLTDAPGIPRGGWRLTVKNALYSRTVIKIVKEAKGIVESQGMVVCPCSSSSSSHAPAALFPPVQHPTFAAR